MTRTAVACLLTVLAFVPACEMLSGTDFPYGMSLDKHNFVSSEHLPLSLTLVDTTTGETVWELDIPVGQMAVVDFEREDGAEASLTPGGPANRIVWGVMDRSAERGNLDQSQELPGNPVLLKVAVREEDKARQLDDALPAEEGVEPRPEDL